MHFVLINKYIKFPGKTLNHHYMHLVYVVYWV